jgi:hypothetical protein
MREGDERCPIQVGRSHTRAGNCCVRFVCESLFFFYFRLRSLKKRFRALEDQIMIQVNNAALFVFKSVEASLLIKIHLFAYDIQ